MNAIEIVGDEPFTVAEAEQITAEINRSAEIVWALLAQAYTRRAWAALGYESWDSYCVIEFRESRIRMPRAERAEVVSSLRESGLSLRAIEAATGVSRPTIIKDLADTQVVKFLPPEPPGGVTANTPGQTDRVAAALAAAQAKQDVAPAEPIAVPETITGTDGKTYKKKPVKKKPVIEPEPVLETETEPEPAADVEHQETPEMTGWWLHFNSRWYGCPSIHIEYEDSKSVDHRSGGVLPSAITPRDARYLAAALRDRLADIEGIIAKLEHRAGESR